MQDGKAALSAVRTIFVGDVDNAVGGVGEDDIDDVGGGVDTVISCCLQWFCCYVCAANLTTNQPPSLQQTPQGDTRYALRVAAAAADVRKRHPVWSDDEVSE